MGSKHVIHIFIPYGIWTSKSDRKVIVLNILSGGQLDRLLEYFRLQLDYILRCLEDWIWIRLTKSPYHSFQLNILNAINVVLVTITNVYYYKAICYNWVLVRPGIYMYMYWLTGSYLSFLVICHWVYLEVTVAEQTYLCYSYMSCSVVTATIVK